jgi:hypothetical protein
VRRSGGADHALLNVRCILGEGSGAGGKDVLFFLSGLKDCLVTLTNREGCEVAFLMLGTG